MGHPHLHIEPSLYTAEKCRRPKYSNGIELSQFVQVLLHFTDLGPLGLLGRRQQVGGIWRYGRFPTCMPAYTPHTCTHMHIHAKIYMYCNGYQHDVALMVPVISM